MADDTEARFIAPSPRCPHPERWTSDNAGSTEWEVCELLYGLIRAMQPEFCVELGTYQGHGAQSIGNALLRNGHGWLETVEINLDSISHAKDRWKGLPISFVEMDYMDYTPKVTPIDFIWVDGGDDRIEGLYHLVPYLTHGTIVGLHDAEHYSSEMSTLWTWMRPVRLKTPRGLVLAEVI